MKRTEDRPEPSAEAISFDGGGNAYAEATRAAHARDPRARKLAICGAVLIALYVAGLLLPNDIVWRAMDAHYSGRLLSSCVDDVMRNVQTVVGVLSGNPEFANERGWLIRYVIVALAGAGLALSGAVYQGTFRNALVSPSTLGVMTGANFGRMIWIVFFSSASSLALLTGAGDAVQGGEGGVAEYLGTTTGLALVSFAGCLIVVGLVLLVNRVSGGGTSPIIMIITGQMVAGVLGAISGLVTYYYTYTDPYGAVAELLRELQIASFYREFGLFDLVAITVPLAVTFAVVMRLRMRMQALAFDEGEQRAMGVDTRWTRVAVIALCTLLTAIIVSFCGTVGFVGFLVPHLARRLVGPSFKYLLPGSALIGAIFVLGAYVILNTTLGGDYAQMVGMYISIAGAAVFLATALRGKGARLGGFR